MATPGWRSGHPLNEQWRAQPAGFDYYQLVSLLLRERTRSRGVPASVDRDLRFRGDLSAAFPGHEVSGLAQARDGAITLSSVNYSVGGYLGPLPDPYADWARERAARGDRAMADFLDLFTDRLHALRFAIKAQARPALGGGAPEQTALGGALTAFAGLVEEELAAGLPIPRRAVLALAGLLADRRRSAAAITAVLAAFLDAPVVIDQLRGAWQPIPEASQARLGKRNLRLGVDAALGSRVWDQQARIGLTVGPLPIERFHALLPGGEAHGGFVALVKFLTDRAVDCEVCLRTAPQAAPLGAPAARLGFTCWIGDTGRATGEAHFVVCGFADAEAA